MGFIKFICYNEKFKKYNIAFTKSFMELPKAHGPDNTSIMSDSTPQKTDSMKMHLSKQDFLNYTQTTCIYANHRLAINDTSANAHQPFEDPILHMIRTNPELRKRPTRKMLCDGEIYNYKELLKDFKENDLSSTSDLEIILQMYIKYGLITTLNKLKGDFAFVLTEKETFSITVTAARDPLGIKPLYLIELKNDDSFYMFVTDPSTLPKSEFFDFIITEVPPGTFWTSTTKKFTSYQEIDTIKNKLWITKDPETLNNLYIHFYNLFKELILLKLPSDKIDTIGMIWYNDFGSLLFLSMLIELKIFENKTIKIFFYDINDIQEEDIIKRINSKITYKTNNIQAIFVTKQVTKDHLDKYNIKVLMHTGFLQNVLENDNYNDYYTISSLYSGIQLRFVYFDNTFINDLKNIDNDLKNVNVLQKAFTDILF